MVKGTVLTGGLALLHEEIERLRARVEELTKTLQIHAAVLEEMGLDSDELEAALKERDDD